MASTASPAHPTTAPAKTVGGFFKHTFGLASGLVSRLAKLLHVSKATVVFLLILILLFIIAFLAICYIRYANKKRRKAQEDRGEVFDDLPLPNFDEFDPGYGHLTFSLNYNIPKKTLTIGLLCATNLKATVGSPMDCYMAICLVEPPTFDEDAKADAENARRPSQFPAPPPASAPVQLPAPVPNGKKEVETKAQREEREREEEAEKRVKRDEFLAEYVFKVASSTYVSAVVENSNSPVFNEVVTISKPLSYVLSHWLLFDIYDRDLSGRDLNYGRVVLPFTEMDTSLFVGPTIEETHPITPAPQSVSTVGDLCIVLFYQPTPNKETLFLTVLEARDLQMTDAMIGPGGGKLFISVTLYHSRDSKWKERTSRHSPAKSRHPYFNETFRFEVPPGFVTSGWAKVRLIYLSPRLGLRRQMGKLTFGVQDWHHISTRCHWREAVKCPNRALPRWHTM